MVGRPCRLMMAGTIAVTALAGSAYGWSATVPAGSAASLVAAPPSLVAALPGPAPVTTATSASPVPSVTPTGPSRDSQVRAAVVAAVGRARARGITQSVFAIDRHAGETISSIHADRAVPAMSLAKLLFAVDVLDTAGGADRVDPDTLARLHRMIATSDDALADAFYSTGGRGQIVERIAARYHLSHTRPSPEWRYWGDIRVTAADMASLLVQALADPRTGPFLSAAMRASTSIARDGFDQEFGMNAVAGAGSKQGWGCCLGGVVAIHSVGFTDDVIVAVLSTAAPDTGALNVPWTSASADDPGVAALVSAVTATAGAASVWSVRAGTGAVAGSPVRPLLG